jgi:Domain of unknown function (DUF4281)
MFDPQLAFSLTGPLVLAAWAGLILSLFVKPVRAIAWPAAQFGVPAILAALYVPLLWAGFGEAQGGGYGSIEEIRALFASDSALVAGWFHYLAFDLFVGSWIVREGIDRNVPRLLILLCLPLTFLFGPAGLLLFLLVRVGVRRVPVAEAA